jgi:superoxide dismutase, Cu-Zn family
MPRLLKTVPAACVLIALSSSLATALGRHLAYDGMVMGVGGSKIRGEIAMERGSKPRTTVATVEYKGDVAGSKRPWHVHVGTCAKGGPVLGNPAAYTPLTVSATGTAKGKATLAITIPDTGDYYVNIHESATAMGKIVACGDLLTHE